MAKYLITGGTGFLGHHLVARLREQGHEVVALCRTAAPELEKLGAQVVRGDVLNAASVEAAAAGCDGLFHCAGLVSRAEEDSATMMQVHVEGTRVNMMLIPGQITRNRYRFERPGEYTIICHEYCGVGHHTMYGKVVVK